ncbi:MAG: Jag N-terminal domain-containing protein [Desulfovibrio sp.]|jgi:spoIIIJ-associated protein|nr:Jag N-terminal domain-containing protein [Desulfovibrio sp.]
MSQYKDFQGKSLDDAISEACAYYGVAREKLEIEIVSDAKTGIFGLVGIKKARIRAARVQPLDKVYSLPEVADTAPAKNALAAGQDPQSAGRDNAAEPAPEQKTGFAPHTDNSAGKDKNAPRRDKKGKTETSPLPGIDGRRRNLHQAASHDGGPQERERREHVMSRKDPERSSDSRASSGAMRMDAAPHAPSGKLGTGGQSEKYPKSGNSRTYSSPLTERNAAATHARNKQNSGHTASKNSKERNRRSAGHAAAQEASNDSALMSAGYPPVSLPPDVNREELSEFPLETCNPDELIAVVSDVIRRLVEPIAGTASYMTEVLDNKVRISIDCGETSGLLVGREGHTLSAVQHLASRIVAKRIGGFLRLQIDAGNYRERQDDKLKEMALALAERAKTTRCPQSTRPLSAYQRRIVHLTLEEDEAVQTHSKGDGAQRRVVVQPKRAAGRGKAPEFSALEELPRHHADHRLPPPDNASAPKGGGTPSPAYEANDSFSKNDAANIPPCLPTPPSDPRSSET